MPDRPPFLVALALVVVRLVARLVPRRDRDEWRREWTHELLHGHARSRHEAAGAWRSQVPLLRRSFGSIADAAWLRRQFTRDAEMLHDLRHTLRLLAARPGSSLLAMVVLAVGIGAATAVAGIVDALLLREPPFPDHDRLVAIWERDTTSAEPRREVAPANFLDWRDAATTVRQVAAIEPWSVDYTGGDRPEVLLAAKVSEGFFDALGTKPLHGRTFQPDDYTLRQGLVVVLDHGVWQRRFGGDPSLVGRTVALDGVPHTVVGVLPPTFELSLLLDEHTRDAYLPQVLQGHERNVRESGWWAVIARLTDEATLEQARTEFAGISARLAAAQPRTNTNVVARLDPIDEHLRGAVRPALVALAAAVGLVVLIVCANVANLLLARGLEREREFAVRSALGAGRGRLVRQLVTESLIVGLTGTVAGIGVGWALVRGVQAFAPQTIAGLPHAALNGRVLLFAIGLGIASAVGFGLAPAWHCSRPSARETLKEGRTTAGSRRASRVRDAIATIEIALAVTVVVGAGLLVRSFVALVSVDPGFAADRVAVVQVFAYDRINRTAAQRAAFFRETVDEMRALPGVTHAGAVSAMPFLPANINIESTLAIEGRPPAPAGEAAPRVFVSAATDGYFETMGIPLMRGRTFTPQDDGRGERVAVVSASLARRFWPDGNPVDAFVTVRFAGPPARVRIVGVVGDLRHDGYEAPAREEVFVAQSQVGFGSMTYVLRTSGDPAAVIGPAQEVVWSRDPLQTIYDTATVPELLSASVAPRRFALVLMAAFAVVALALAAAGIYSVMSVATSQRMREFGVRVALGADRREIARLVLRRAAVLGVVGLAIGLAAAVVAGRAFSNLLFDVGGTDPVAFAGTTGLVLTVTLLASWLPARRANRVDPLVALRDDRG